MIIHNIYIINSEGICPLSIKLGSIDTDPEMVAGIFAASQKFWEYITGEEPQSIIFQNTKAHLKQFTTGQRTWYLVILLELENPELLKTVEKSILEVVIDNKMLFEKFIADTTEISVTIQNQIIEKLQSIPCPYLQRKIFTPICIVNSDKFQIFDCNIVTTSICQERIKEELKYQPKKDLFSPKFPKSRYN
ncbi:MAG: hypothetical protein ACUVXA_09130 [Candidatus Jordarchaeum sp.]|uniref:hypothetical protein n=1 Tax=Candidatus Jordarchaeum sp. TaxID=2823881 RepID=UPI00404AB1F2